MKIRAEPKNSYLYVFFFNCAGATPEKGNNNERKLH